MSRIVLIGVLLGVLIGAPAGRSPAVAQPAAYTLSAAVALALERNPQVRSSAAAVRAAEASAQGARAGRAPTATLSSGAGVSGSPSAPVSRSGDIAVGASYLIYDGGLREAQIRQADAGVERARHDLEAVRSDVSLAAVTAFMALVVAEQTIALRQQVVAQNRTQLQAAQANFRAGTSPRADVVRAESQLATAEFEFIDAQGQLESRRIALGTVLALEPTVPVAVTPPGPPPPVEVAEADAVQRSQGRPEVRRGEAEVLGAEAALASEMIQGGVTATVDGRYVLLSTGTSGGWSVGASVALPIFDGGRKAARVEQARANLDGAKTRLEGTRLQTRQEAVQARLAALSAAARAVAAQRAVDASREALRLSQGRYQAGVGTIVEVATAQTDQVSAEVSLLQVTADRWTAAATLRRAIGLPVLP